MSGHHERCHHAADIPRTRHRRGRLEIGFVRASGPGGQNVNKVSTSAQLRFDTRKLTLPEDAAIRLARIAGQRMTKGGVIVIHAQRFRTQERNRQDAVGCLVEILKKAVARPRPRHAKRSTFASKQRRLEGKRRRSDIKAKRGRGFVVAPACLQQTGLSISDHAAGPTRPRYR
ncbi:ribosome-associated protein [Bradyrhizobium japonicum]|nr:ribosome-associated protein [Bradyrhizobium japonicum]MCP1855637.1 ribosome-associated protein [Bradyrhizobium japonicum]MCP1897546.1 ribosome-associated protein [Bradyrhizobium japonicum]MCW2330404.1 ribosome-associated protein [Bradyrhizobium japonicum]